MSYTECSTFERKLAYHTAPSLLGIKCASIVSLRKNEFDFNAQITRFNLKAKQKSLKIKVLCQCNDRIMLMLYNEKLLSKKINEEKNKKLLISYGYNECFTLKQNLNKLAHRIKCQQEFPHEIGIFLDYPLEDVIGFINNKGENFKYLGCWKVYDNEEKAKKTFENYTKCRNFLCNKLENGQDIYRALKIY